MYEEGLSLNFVQDVEGRHQQHRVPLHRPRGSIPGSSPSLQLPATAETARAVAVQVIGLLPPSGELDRIPGSWLQPQPSPSH